MRRLDPARPARHVEPRRLGVPARHGPRRRPSGGDCRGRRQVPLRLRPRARARGRAAAITRGQQPRVSRQVLLARAREYITSVEGG